MIMKKDSKLAETGESSIRTVAEEQQTLTLNYQIPVVRIADT